MKNRNMENLSKISLKKVEPQKEEITQKKQRGFYKLIDWFINIPLYLVVVLLPIFFLQNVPSALELNKQMLLVGLVGLSALSWVGKMAWRNEVRFRKSFILIPVLTFLLVYTLSTIFSTYYEQSMWGYFGGENKAFVSILFFVAFFVLIYNNVKNYQGVAKLIFAFLISGAVVLLFSILQFFELYILPFEFAKNKFFNPVGSVYIFSIYVAVIFIISISLFLSNISRMLKIVLIVLTFLSFFFLMIVNFKILWIILMVVLAFILGMTTLIEGNKPSQSRVLPMVFLALTLFFLMRAKPIVGNAELPIEIFLKNKTAAEISFNSIKENPLLGSGPTTFANVYKKNRPSDLGDFSVVNFNESTSFFLTLVSTTGILGTVAFLFLVLSGLVVFFKDTLGAILKSDQKNNFNSYLGVSVGGAWLFLTIFLFFYFANITILMLWWLFFGLMVSVSFLNKKEKDGDLREIKTTSNSPKTSFFLSFGFVLVIIGFIAVIYLQSQKYIAAIYFNQAVKASSLDNNIEKTAEKMSKAVSLDPNRDSYYRDLSVVHLALAKEKIVEKGLENLSPEESNYVSSRFRSALQSLTQAKTLNPSNSLNFVSVANLYEEFIVIQKDSGEKAIENYQAAIELDPKNPEIYQSMANVQITLADLETIEANSSKKQGDKIEIPKKALEYLAMSEEYLKKALEIKSDYVGANVLLVTVYEKQENVEKAIEKSKENLEIYPNSAELKMDLGRIYYQQENFDEAEKYLKQALVVNRQYSNARYMLGLVLDKKDDTDGAIAEFKKIQELNPENELLGKIIENLESGKDIFEGTGDVRAEEVINEDVNGNIEAVEEEINNTSPEEQPAEENNPEENNPEELPAEEVDPEVQPAE